MQGRSNLAYLMNAYPMTSTTFIRREIEALEALGLIIHRYAVREWSGRLVDTRDVSERDRTQYLLTNNIVGLFGALLAAIVTNPRGLLRAAPVWVHLIRNAGGEYVRHFAYFMQACHFHALAARQRIAHVHVHFSTNAATVAMLSRLMGGPSYSFTVHGPDELVIAGELSLALKVEHAQFVITISEFCRRFVLDNVRPEYRDKIRVARCGLALEEFEDVADVTTSGHTLVCVGRLCPQKGQLLIPKAVARLREQFPDLKIILIGDGETRDAVESAIEQCRVGTIVELRGWVENRAVLRILKSCRALLLPSFAEGLPVVIMESLALGIPVISTSIAGIPELVDEECGWLFHAGDEDGLIEAVRAALECPPARLQRMSAIGRERVFRLHDRKKLALFLREQFDTALGEPRRQEIKGTSDASQLATS